jgi:hypothetical protein
MAATRRLARNTRVDISTDNVNWVKLPGRTDTAPAISPTKVDSTDYDTNGFVSYEITLQAWSLVAKYNKLITTGTPDVVQETVRAAQAQFGTAARVYVRWYDTDGGPEAWTGLAIVELSRSKTGVADLAEITLTLTGDGALTAISNPYAVALAPVVTGASPTAIAVGGVVQITGVGFTGTVVTTGVKFGGVNATSWIVVSDSVIVAVMPAGSAGSAVVLVTNATGASNALPYTRT